MTTLKQYKKEIDTIPGNDLIKAKTFIERNINSWCLDQEGLLIDVLDATHLTAFDVLDVLEGIAEVEADHVDFHNAVLALRVTLAKKNIYNKSSPGNIPIFKIDDSTDFDTDAV